MASVLIVDDEGQLRTLMCETLKEAGYRVTEAFRQYRMIPADLVIMDILMPNQDGLETTVTLRREFPM